MRTSHMYHHTPGMPICVLICHFCCILNRASAVWMFEGWILSGLLNQWGCPGLDPLPMIFRKPSVFGLQNHLGSQTEPVPWIRGVTISGNTSVFFQLVELIWKPVTLASTGATLRTHRTNRCSRETSQILGPTVLWTWALRCGVRSATSASASGVTQWFWKNILDP